MNANTPATQTHPNDPWSIEDWAFPRTESASEQLAFLLNYAVLAPSGHNTQPWRFKIAGADLGLFADRTRSLPAVDPGDRELIMSCGAALFHLRVAIRHFGYAPVVRPFPDPADPDLLAFVRLGERLEATGAPTMEDDRLFTAIKQRHTNRRPFADRPVPDEELGLLEAAALQEGARLHLFTQPERKGILADLIAEGDRIQGADEDFRRELAAWLHPNRSRRRDGIPGYAQGVGDLRSYIGPFVVRTFDWGGGRAAKDRQLAEGSPVLLVLSTEDDDAPAHLAAGQALARVLLTATTYGLSASFLNQPLEVAALRPEVARLIGTSHPQLILRLGYGPEVPTTPRRPARAVLSSSRYL